MQVLKHIISTGQKIKVEYPRFELTEAVTGLDNDIEYYEIVETDGPNYNPDWHILNDDYELTEETGQYGEHLKKALHVYTITLKSQDDILIAFNNCFGQWIDEVYPIWKRIKDVTQPSESGTARQIREMDVRDDRQKRENDLLNNNILPNFKFDWL